MEPKEEEGQQPRCTLSDIPACPRATGTPWRDAVVGRILKGAA
jgi:hypothetical protein